MNQNLCACELLRQAIKEDKDFDVYNPDENSPAYPAYEVAKDLAEKWQCPNWKQIKIPSHVKEPAHRLNVIHDNIKLEDSECIDSLRKLEEFAKAPEGTYHTCPKFYHSPGSPIFDELAEASLNYQWFDKGQLQMRNSNPNAAEIEQIDAILLGNSISTDYYNKKHEQQQKKMEKTIQERENALRKEGKV